MAETDSRQHRSLLQRIAHRAMLERGLLPDFSPQALAELDALVGSGEDDGELYRAGDLDPAPNLVVTTSGGLGGWVQPGGPFRPAPLPGPVVDAYGCGDCFAAGLTFALGRGDPVEEAIALAARCGAAVMTGRGPYAAQLDARSASP